MKKVEIWLDLTGEPLTHYSVTSTYQKGDFYCVYIQSEQLVYKYPVVHIFRVVESYLDSSKRSEK